MQTEEQDEQLTLLEDKAARFKFSFRPFGQRRSGNKQRGSNNSLGN